MELKRNDIIKALDILERFDFFQGQRAGRELWNEKPFDVQEQDIAKFSQDVAWLKNYIKELTEENERLKSLCEAKDDIINKIAANSEEIGIVAIRAISETEADTVRKMQERLKEEFADDSIHGQSEIYCVVDHIANEVLGEKK